ncbi:beta-ketoacyl-ACP synthase [Candidatus Desantisbacteria bacterium]|nr:beta-ketoacyl-ACP synthase [Candidatus Desantisbacteria bacterium]
MNDHMQRRVVITGMGIISPIGHNVNDYGQSLKIGQNGIEYLENLSKPAISVKIGAKISNFSFESIIQQYTLLGEEILQKAKHCTWRLPYAIQCSVLSALEAWIDARLNKVTISPDRFGIIIAGSNLTMNFQYDLYQKFFQSFEYITPSYALHYMDTDHVGILSEVFDIRGEGFTVGGASASGNVGILKGYQLIQLGVVDACMVVGSIADLSPMELQGFYNIGAMGGKRFHDQPEKACRPFDKDHEGFIYGQASGCLILESLESAKKRDIHILAEILGASLILDGNRLSNPNEDGEVRAMEFALNQAKVKAEDVDYINAHGSSSQLGDETEIRAIRRVFKKNLSRVWINSTKGLIGHCLYSAGVVEAIAVIIQIRDRFVHPNINLDNPIDDECRFNRAISTQADINIAMSNSFGFGGINTSILLKRAVL